MLKIKAHKLRALAASFAYFYRTPLEEILRAAVCFLTVFFNGSAPLNKMATMLIYGKKNLKIFFSRTRKL